MSRRFSANLDIGHFVVGNNDPIEFIRKHASRISHLHLNDRRRDNGPNRPWGQGDTPVAEVLRLCDPSGTISPRSSSTSTLVRRRPSTKTNCKRFIQRALSG
jgi:hypothetical protein